MRSESGVVDAGKGSSPAACGVDGALGRTHGVHEGVRFLGHAST